MKKFVSACIGILLTASAALAQDPARLYSEPALPSPEVLDRLNLKVAWRAYVPTDARRDGIASVQIADLLKGVGQQVLIQTRSAALIAIDAATGMTLWRARAGTPYAATQPLGVNSSTVFAVNAAQLYALNRATGDVLWVLDLPNAPSAGPVADEEHVFVTLGTGKLNVYAIPKPGTLQPTPPPRPAPEAEPEPGLPRRTEPEPPPQTPSELYRRTTSAFGVSGQSASSVSAVSSAGRTVRSISAVSSQGRSVQSISAVTYNLRGTGGAGVGPQPALVWSYLGETRLEIAPVLTPEFVLVAGYSGEFYALSKFDGRLLYRYQAGPPLTAPIGQFEYTAYVASQDFNAYALDIVPGRILWRFLGGGPITRRPIVNDDSVFLTPERAGLYRLNRETGDTIWRNNNAERFLAANPKFVYATDRTGRLLVLDRARGTQLGVYGGAWNYVVPVSNDLTDRLFLAANDGLIVCLHDRDYAQPARMKAYFELPPESAAAEKKAAASEKAEIRKPEPAKKEKKPMDEEADKK
jgi:outer membrane protein assembly factor BamB